MAKKPIVLTLGDRYGVGPELAARLILEGAKIANLVIVGDRRVFDDARERHAPGLEVIPIATLCEAKTGAPQFLDLSFDAPVGPLGRVETVAGKESLRTLDWIADAVKNQTISGAVYGPLNKQAMRDAGHVNGDEFDYLSGRLGIGSNAGEINCLEDIWTSRVTSHIPLAQVATHITREAVEASVRLLHDMMVRAGIETPRLAVAGINPHAGEQGVFGTEEISIIGPAVAAMRATGLNVSGPYPADTIFPQARAGGLVGIVTMYHDQGQIALRLLGLGRSVTLLGGLAVPITTPGHGTAFDIVGQGKARMDGLRSALELCKRMAA
ncbi:4-hydroxythreonine-4-phosphate dehydrogenase PdxA [Devosia algicola]|uniref:4-hydroxythreonine-4-phosphate dehydrogenase PdxA n=1 Tax=Devosia algicola TaxID=3026418 RepID=A0ABY7YQA4_9HYPH|nr:4-hydroxythreonine-4-phosphate dehydrogenase PdxA [Devosia algicola]WDR03498.1 4-hydroxythreonine-4-phosphate dehydrogenase PdxA [Devosia algicola]